MLAVGFSSTNAIPVDVGLAGERDGEEANDVEEIDDDCDIGDDETEVGDAKDANGDEDGVENSPGRRWGVVGGSQ